MSNRNIVIQTKVELITEECCSCGVLFAIPNDLQSQLRKTHKTFFCPNGHSQSYTGKSEAEKAREELEKERQRHKETLARANEAQAKMDKIARQLKKEKQALANKHRRAVAGTCPCCKRTFKQLQRHMANKHPEQLAGGAK